MTDSFFVMNADASRAFQIDLRRAGGKWLLEVDHKPVMVTRDGRWLRQFTSAVQRRLAARFQK